MHKITPQQIFLDQPPAHNIDVTADDNLKDRADFRVMYYDEQGRPLDKCSYVECSGADYIAWPGDNDFPVEFVAQKLGLTLEQG